MGLHTIDHGMSKEAKCRVKFRFKRSMFRYEQDYLKQIELLNTTKQYELKNEEGAKMESRGTQKRSKREPRESKEGAKTE